MEAIALIGPGQLEEILAWILSLTSSALRDKPYPHIFDFPSLPWTRGSPLLELGLSVSSHGKGKNDALSKLPQRYICHKMAFLVTVKINTGVLQTHNSLEFLHLSFNLTSKYRDLLDASKCQSS